MSSQDRPAGSSRVSPFAWWSVGLGVMALLPCFWIYFIPALSAIICGVLARRQVDFRPGRFHGAGLGLTGLIMGIVSIALGITVLALAAYGVWEWPATQA